jgi:hypothetical protein
MTLLNLTGRCRLLEGIMPPSSGCVSSRTNSVARKMVVENDPEGGINSEGEF